MKDAYKYLIGIIAFLLIVYILAKVLSKKSSTTSDTTNNTSRRGINGINTNQCLNCISNFEQELKGLSSIYTPPTYGQPSVTYNWRDFSSAVNKLKNCVS